MSITHKQLERQALAAHRRGDDWRTFWPSVADAVAQAEPYDRSAYRRLRDRLSHLLVCGDVDGMTPAGDAPWEADDNAARYPQTDDSTVARLQLQFPEATA